jgi:hypothetical protein
MGLGEWSYWAEQHCPYEPSFMTPYLVLPHNTTVFITLALYAIGLVRRELYLFLLGLGVSSNALLNLLLKWAFMQPVPYGPCGLDHVYCPDPHAPLVTPVNGTDPEPANSCGTPPWPDYDPASPANCGAPPLDPCAACVSCGMPAFEAQDTAFFVAAIFLYMFTWRHPHIRLVHSFLLVAWLTVMAWSHSFFGFNSPGQIVAGAAIGAAYAMFWHALVFVWLYPYFDTMLAWAPARWLEYRDTFCRTHEPVPGDPDE